MFFLRPVGSQFVDLGDKALADYTVIDFTCDGAYHDLDISSIVGHRKCLVMIRLLLNAIEASSYFGFRTKGYTNLMNREGCYTQVSGFPRKRTMWLMTNSSGQIEYKGDSATWAIIDVTICGYFKI